MLRVRCAVVLFLICVLQLGLAETDEVSEATVDEELDEEFLEVIGAIEAEDDEWFDIFLATIDEADEVSTAEIAYE